jgi:molybdenum cofactor biosynthesis enzyme MoaA
LWDGIQAAEAAGLVPMKLNAVIVQGYNEDDVVELAALTLQHDWQMRFISRDAVWRRGRLPASGYCHRPADA